MPLNVRIVEGAFINDFAGMEDTKDSRRITQLCTSSFYVSTLNLISLEKNLNECEYVNFLNSLIIYSFFFKFINTVNAGFVLIFNVRIV